MPIIRLNGKDIYFASRGTSGPAVVFLHGAGGNHLIWNGQLAALADVATSYGIDLPGHGRSAGTGRDSIDEYSRDILGFLDAVGISKAVVVGHSMGGGIALTTALNHPERVNGIGLVGTGARLRVLPEFLTGITMDFDNVARKINQNSFSDHADSSLVAAGERDILANSPEVLSRDYAACDRFDVMNRVADIRVNSLIICGKQDRMTPVKYSEYLAAKLRQSKLVLIDGAGHNVMLEKPDLLNHALREWLLVL